MTKTQLVRMYRHALKVAEKYYEKHGDDDEYMRLQSEACNIAMLLFQKGVRV